MSRRIQQLPIAERVGHDAIFRSKHLTDIPAALTAWSVSRVLIVASRSLDSSTNVVKNLERTLGGLVSDKKIGVGSHSPYTDVIDIANRIQENDIDCVISIGSGSYSDACKIARLVTASLPPGFTANDMESLVDQSRGLAGPDKLKSPTVKLIVVPTSLSAGEWNYIGSSTNASGKKQHFAHPQAAPDLILLDPDVARTAPAELWLSSGVRAVDHCVETMCNSQTNDQADEHMERGLRSLLKGLTEYKQGNQGGNELVLFNGIDDCQNGARESMMGILIWGIGMGPSHAIGHQLGSVAGVLHGITSCIMLAPVLRHTKSRSAKAQEKVLRIFNDTFGWSEIEAGDAVERFIKTLELPTRLSQVGMDSEEQIDRVADKTMTDIWGGRKRQIDTKEEVLEILRSVR